MLGYVPDEYLKNADFWRARVHPEDLAAGRGRAGQAVRARAPHRRISLPQEGRHLLLGERRAASGPRPERQPLEVVGSWSEVTARKTAEQAALHASEQRLTDAIEIDLGRLLAVRRAGPARARQLQISPSCSITARVRQSRARPTRRSCAAPSSSGLIEDARGPARRLAPAASGAASQSRRAAAGAPRPTAAGSRSASGAPRLAARVAVYSDLTELKESEQRAAAANQLILQSLRYAQPHPGRRSCRRAQELDAVRRRPFPDLGAARHRRRRLLLVPADQRRAMR